MTTKPKNKQELKDIKTSGQMLAKVLELLKKVIEPNMTTKDLAVLAAKELKSLGGKPAFLGYYGFPDVLCVSINDEIIHGIPSAKKIIHKADIVSLDFGVIFNGMITDAAISVAIDSNNSRDSFLLKHTEKALLSGIDKVKPGVRVGDLSTAIQNVLDKSQLGIVREYVGHGVGHHLHEEPNIPNYGQAGTGPVLLENMTIAIEPMATLGSEQTIVDSDGWTVRTMDGSRAAHFEHTVLITKEGAEILTQI